MATLTAANSVFMLGAAGLFNVPIKIQGYSADDAFATEEVEFIEKFIGVDGILSAGYTPYMVTLEFTLQADSASNDIMDTIISAQKVKREVILLNASIQVPAVAKLYTFTTGFFDKGPVMPSAGKTLKPRKYSLVFQDLSVAPI